MWMQKDFPQDPVRRMPRLTRATSRRSLRRVTARQDGENEANDAGAICDTANRSRMRFIPSREWVVEFRRALRVLCEFI